MNRTPNARIVARGPDRRGFTEHQLQTLFAVERFCAHHPDPVSMVELARSLGASREHTSTWVSALESRWLVKMDCINGRRFIRITDKGRKHVEYVMRQTSQEEPCAAE